MNGFVAQIFNLLYRRIAFGNPLLIIACSEFSNRWRIKNPRYSRLKICATVLSTISRTKMVECSSPAAILKQSFSPGLTRDNHSTLFKGGSTGAGSCLPGLGMRFFRLLRGCSGTIMNLGM
jgi:hypothetical protein